MTALVSVAASFGGKAVVVSTPFFWGQNNDNETGKLAVGRFARTFRINTHA
jgi:hypothetical protein